MNKIIFDIGTLSTKFNFISMETPYVITSSTEYHETFNINNNVENMIKFYTKFPDIDPDRPYGSGTFIAHNQIIDKNKYSDFFGYCFNFLHCDPTEQKVAILVPPIDQQNFRKTTMAILFENYACQSLQLDDQSIFSYCKHVKSGTFLTVMSGFTDTYIVPCVKFHPLENCTQHLPFGGYHVTKYIADSIAEKNKNRIDLIRNDLMWIAERIKQNSRRIHRYDNFDIHDVKCSIRISQRKETNPISGKVVDLRIGHEFYLTPELVLAPEMMNKEEFEYTLPMYIDEIIRATPKEYHRRLYKNITLTGAPMIVKEIKERIHAEMKILANSLSNDPNEEYSTKVRCSSPERNAYDNARLVYQKPAPEITHAQYFEEGAFLV
ncbi:hypothetical protein TRFO_40254 [Tritrichomonas foetus]|uniref:Actin-like protein n=1 Tax=Tritrichomonas foetus TaxID=1144522 RepID=A0A1J4J264_9EUKA|nr:hypothetical protein TRFO_40254 [Tritrichomonas foetus]|eukprot:OHS93466.1 hypothetical protein TRFO_40254 [Tritrichomonas foetus]